jgi:hypothetical protein
MEGLPAPPVVIEGWKHLSNFPRSSWESFWLLLAPVLMNPGNTSNQELITLFCKEHDISPECTLMAIGCCEQLLKQAAALDLSEDLFYKDLLALTGESPDDLAQFIRKRFSGAMKGLRQQILMDTLATHGKVMTGLEWRLDRVKQSSRGSHLNTDIVLLTLNYQEGGKQDKISLQLNQEAAKMLHDFCCRIGTGNKK